MAQVSVAKILHLVFLQIAPIVISVIALYVSLHDRRPKLKLQARKGEWCVLRRVRTETGENVKFEGTLEVYNKNARANAVKGYQFWYKGTGKWEPMRSERFTDVSPDNREEIFNDTPATIAPCSGRELWVAAFAPITPLPKELDIRVEVEDLFGKRCQTVVKARL
jgi:hypothetical protein